MLIFNAIQVKIKEFSEVILQAFTRIKPYNQQNKKTNHFITSDLNARLFWNFDLKFKIYNLKNFKDKCM